MILEKSRGNPFFAEEVIRSLIDTRMIYRDGGSWKSQKGAESVAVPESVRSIVLSRVDRLEEDLRRVLEAASVIGRLFRRRVLESVTQRGTDLGRALSELEEDGFIYLGRRSRRRSTHSGTL